MNENAMKKGTHISLVLSMLFMAFAARSNTFVAPALAAIAKQFPNVSMANIQLIMTCGMIGNFPMTLIMGAIADKVRPKPTIILGCMLISIGALFPIVLHSSIFLLYFSNFMMGVGQGIVLTFNSILIAQLFQEPERGRLLGWRGSVQQVGSMIMGLIAGWCALLGWYNIYWTGLVTIPSLLVVIFMLPDVEKAEKTREESSNAADMPRRKGIPIQTWIIAIYIFLFGVPFAVNIINSAMLLDEKLGLGPEMAGVTNAVTGLASILIGIIYKNFANMLKQNLLWFGTAIVTLGLYLQYICNNYPIFLLGGCLVMVGFIFTFTGGIHAFPRMVAANQVSFGIGFFMALQSLGSMLTPYLINPIADSIYGKSSALGNYKVAIVWGCIVIVIGIFWAIGHRKYYKTDAQITS
jgi:MFS family permease